MANFLTTDHLSLIINKCKSLINIAITTVNETLNSDYITSTEFEDTFPDYETTRQINTQSNNLNDYNIKDNVVLPDNNLLRDNIPQPVKQDETTLSDTINSESNIEFNDFDTDDENIDKLYI